MVNKVHERAMKTVLIGFLLSFVVLAAVADYKESRLEVKAFINDHAHLYENFEVKYIGGADPELVFIKNDQSEERIAVDEMETEQICKTLEDRGFSKRAQEEIPSPPTEEL